MTEHEGITFNATFAKATTLIDGGWRISLDLPDFEAQKVTALAQLSDRALQVAIVPLPKDEF